MNDELIVIKAKDLEACDSDRKAYLELAVLLYNRLLRYDTSFKDSYEHDKAQEVLGLNG